MKEIFAGCGRRATARELAPQVLGAVVRRFRDFAAAEDAVQEAMLAAFTQWPREGVPENPTRLVDSGRVPPHDRPGGAAKLPVVRGKPRSRGTWRPWRRPTISSLTWTQMTP